MNQKEPIILFYFLRINLMYLEPFPERKTIIYIKVNLITELEGHQYFLLG